MAIVHPTKHLTTIAEWRRLGEADIFPPDSCVELINGEIFDRAPIGFNHAGHVIRLLNVFAALAADKALVSAQNPLQLGDLSEPQPDFMLLKPCADDVLLLIEVADSSLSFDQNQKLRLYALHGIAEYWLLNLPDNCLEVYRKPHDKVYAEKMTLYPGDTVSLWQWPNLSVPIAKLL